MILTYISGPIRGSKGQEATLDEQITNSQEAFEAFGTLLANGFAPVLPHADVMVQQYAKLDISFEMAIQKDYAMLEICDAVLRLRGDSEGADLEVARAKELGIPVYVHIDDLLRDRPAKGDARFHALLRDLGRLHDRKQKDYGSNSDPFANVRSSQDWGIPAWVGAMVRANDKVKRLMSFARRGTLHNESAEDSLLDIAVYSLIAYILMQETKEQPSGTSMGHVPGSVSSPIEAGGNGSGSGISVSGTASTPAG